MTTDLSQLERELERETRLLAHLPPVTPSPAGRDRARRAMFAEAAALRRRTRWLGVWRVVGATAAAIALLLALRTTPSPAPSSPPGADPETYVADWLAAVDATADQMVALVDDPWRPTTGAGYDEDAALGDLLDGLDAAMGDGI